MYCKHCGNRLEIGQRICDQCGQPVEAVLGPDGYPVNWVGSLPFWDNFKMCMTEKYLKFEGRATRGEYWKFVLSQFVIILILESLLAGFGFAYTSTVGDIATLVVCLPFLLPSLAVQVRRLHDLNRSAWWLFLHLVPYAGSFVLFIFSIMKSNPMPNDYGPLPDYSNYEA